MADIAFLLLIFFLVTTTIDMDKGIIVKLPQWFDDVAEPTPINNRNVLEILINGNDELLVEGQTTNLKDLSLQAIQFLDNNGTRQCDYCNGIGNTNSSDHPNKAIISFASHRNTSYDAYINVYDELIKAYYTLRDELSLKQYDINYKELKKDEKEVIEKMYPMLLSEAEPY